MTRKRELYASAIRSREMIREALLALMKEKAFEDITISEIMKRADLVRRTFYAHFKTKEDVIAHYIDELVSASFDDILRDVEECSGTMALVYFRLWYGAKEFVSLLHQSNQLILLNTFHHQIQQLQEKNEVFTNMGFETGAENYAAKFYAGAMWSVLTQWIETGMKETPEELSDILNELFSISQCWEAKRK